MARAADPMARDVPLAHAAVHAFVKPLGLRLTCTHGALWITVDGEVADHVLAAGESFAPSSRRRVLVYALEDAMWRVQPASSRDPVAKGGSMAGLGPSPACARIRPMEQDSARAAQVADPTVTGRVLVVGATGALGRPVVRLLRARGVAVRTLNRHPAQAADLAAIGAEVVAGDLTDPASLARACSGVERVLAAAHSLFGRGRWRSEAVDDAGHRTLIAAARAAGVRRFVYTSAHGVAADHLVDFFRTKHRIERLLVDSGLDAVILRPTAFMEQHVHLFNGKAVLDKGKASLVGPGTKRRNFVAAADVARFAVRALLEEPPPFRVLDIGGQGNFSNAEIASLYAREAGIAARASHLPVGVARVISAAVSPLHPGVARIMKLMSLPDDAFDERFDGAATLERDFGITLTTVEQFVRERVREARKP